MSSALGLERESMMLAIEMMITKPNNDNNNIIIIIIIIIIMSSARGLQREARQVRRGVLQGLHAQHGRYIYIYIYIIYHRRTKRPACATWTVMSVCVCVHVCVQVCVASEVLWASQLYTIARH